MKPIMRINTLRRTPFHLYRFPFPQAKLSESPELISKNDYRIIANSNKKPLPIGSSYIWNPLADFKSDW
jgi:hypothetical protein